MARRLLRNLRLDQRGTALIEFAFVVPVLALMFLGGFQLMDAISCYRKVTTTARTLADLTTQNPSITTVKADSILNASRQVMAPYSTTNAVLRITQVYIPANLQPVVNWSRAVNGTGYTKGASVVVPDLIKQANTYLIYSEITFRYVPNLGGSYIGTIPFRDQVFMAPRRSTCIPLDPDTCS